MDLLGSVLRSLTVTDSSIGTFEFERPWGYSAPAFDGAAFVYSPIHGECWLSVSGKDTVLRPGDVGLVFGGPYEFRSNLEARAVSFANEWSSKSLPPLGPSTERDSPLQVRWARDGSATDFMLALAFTLQDVVQSPVLSVLPKLIVMRSEAAGLAPWLEALKTFVADECRAPKAGYNAIARQLATSLFMLMVRSYAVFTGTQNASWLRGMRDPHIGPVLALMHDRFQQSWNLDELARESGLGRSTFSRRFQEIVGRPPMDYLSSVRLEVAARQLAKGMPVARVAEQVGYQSEVTFRQAFLRYFGVSPLKYGKSIQS